MADVVLSIIIPMYNASQYIRACLESIIDYDGKDIEILVIDDGSKDDSIEKIALMHDERIRLFTQKNMGPSSARNRGISNSQGDFVMFVDSDDWLEKGSIKTIIDYIKNTSADTLVFNAFVFSKTHKVKKTMSLPAKYSLSERTELEKTLLGSFSLASPWAKVYSMEIIQNNKILFQEDIRYYEDILFNIRYFRFSQSGYFINEYVYNYRDNQNSLSRNFSFAQLDSLIYIYKIRLLYFENYFLKNYAYRTKFKKHIDDDIVRSLFLNIVSAKRNGIDNGEITKYIQSNDDISSLLTSNSYLNIGTIIRTILVKHKYYSFMPFNILINAIIQLKYVTRRHSK